MRELSKLEQHALVRRTAALEKAVNVLLEEGKKHAKVIEGFGDIARVADVRSRLALAIARGDADVDKVRVQFDELKSRMTKKYGVSPDV